MTFAVDIFVSLPRTEISATRKFDKLQLSLTLHKQIAETGARKIYAHIYTQIYWNL